jgi:hypothetical protein
MIASGIAVIGAVGHGDVSRVHTGTAQAVSAKVVFARLAARSGAGPALAVPQDDQYIYTRDVLVERKAGSAAKLFVDESWRSVDGSKPSRVSEHGKTWTSAPLGPNESQWPPTRYADLAQLPTEPRALLSAVLEWPRRAKARESGPLSSTEYDDAYLDLLFLLHGWRVMPPGLQAAAFQALGLIPGVEVVKDHDHARGRPAFAIRRPADHSLPGWTLLVDRETYAYLGLRTTGDGIEQMMWTESSGVVDRIGQRPAPDGAEAGRS